MLLFFYFSVSTEVRRHKTEHRHFVIRAQQWLFHSATYLRQKSKDWLNIIQFQSVSMFAWQKLHRHENGKFDIEWSTAFTPNVLYAKHMQKHELSAKISAWRTLSLWYCHWLSVHRFVSGLCFTPNIAFVWPFDGTYLQFVFKW